MSDVWEGLRVSLGALLHVCEDEQNALVMLDGDRLAKLEISKANLVRQVAQEYKQLENPEASPQDVAVLADHCRRMNAANRRMLVLTLQCVDNILTAAGHARPKRYGDPASAESRRGLMDLRV